VSPAILSKNPEMQILKRKRKDESIRGNAARVWVGFKNPGRICGKKGKIFQKEKKREGPVQKKGFGPGVGPTFERFGQGEVQQPCATQIPARFFFGLGLWPPTPFLLRPDPAAQRKRSCPESFLVGNGRS
jgi:hypothetical protein